MSPLPDRLVTRLRELARAPVLLVACDYDGTLSPIVADPYAAVPDRASIAALCALASLDGTHVAVISGRALRDLAALSRAPAGVRLVGSHGAEWDLDLATDLTPEQVAVLHEMRARADELVHDVAGAMVESKPAGFAVHVRNVADRALARQVVDGVDRLAGGRPGVHVMTGKEVIEVSVVAADKGAALDRIRRHVRARATIFVGDDITDEKAFGRLTEADIGVKVGHGDSTAGHRVAGTGDVARLLALLLELREAWVRCASGQA